VVYRFHEWALGEAQKTREDMATLLTKSNDLASARYPIQPD
jgi:hypothetical protein